MIVLVCLLASTAGCLPGDLSLTGKRCDSAKPCPADLICVQEPDSASTRLGRCFDSGDAPSCQPGQRACSPDASWVEVCEADGHSRQVDQICAAEQTCNPDTDSCALPCSGDGNCLADEVCDLGTGLCLSPQVCNPADCFGLCLGTICVPPAPADASSRTGAPELDCFQQAPVSPPGSPALCELTGRVNLFPALDNSDQAIGLQVQLLDAAYPHDVIKQTPVTEGADGAGYYTLFAVQTNRRYVVAILAGRSTTGQAVVTSFNPGLDLRADLCAAGRATYGLTAMPLVTYETYTSGTIAGLDPRRGLIVGRALDCNAVARRPLGNVTVGLAFAPIPPGRSYYFADEEYLIPDLGLEATSLKGYYAAAGVPAVTNAIAFGAKLGPTRLALGRIEFFLEPGSAVIADLPLPQEQLP